jgi:Mrp family chromosome partitioning ATPase
VSKQPPSGTNPAEKSESETPRRRTPTYMEAVKAQAAAAAATKPVEEEPPAAAPAGPKSGVGSRTRIGLPPVTVLPGQRRRETPHTDGGGDGSSSSERGGLSSVPVDPPRVLSRETVLMGAAPRPEPGSDRPQSLVVSRVRAEGASLVPALPPSPAVRGRKARPTVPAAEVTASRHTVPSERKWPLVLLNPKLLPQAASIRSLRHRLADRGEPRVVAVTSATRREGKTFTAVNLALSLAEVRRSRVLLLEANPYQPALASVFGLQKPVCFFEQLEAHKKDFLAPWRVAELSTYDLHLLAVDPRSNKLRALEGGSFAHCLDSLRGAYDYIVIDAPSVSAGPDIPLLEDAVDGLVFVARADRSRAKTLRYALDQVSPQDLLGVVLLDF